MPLKFYLVIWRVKVVIIRGSGKFCLELLTNVILQLLVNLDFWIKCSQPNCSMDLCIMYKCYYVRCQCLMVNATAI